MTFLDWLEANVLFLEIELSQTEVIDYLVEEQLYVERDFASEFVTQAWDIIKRRQSWLGSISPITFDGRWMTRTAEWTDVPAHSFCLMVSLGPKCEYWHDTFGPDYVEQGTLFELVTKSSVALTFEGWQLFHTGWRRDSTSNLSEVVNSLISATHEREGNVDDYAAPQAKDAGVDLMWHLPFADHRGGTPIYLAQCASGLKWDQKVNDPNLSEWSKYVDFAAVPNKAFALPFALDERELRRQSTRAEGLLLDRFRLLAHNVPEVDWVPEDLRVQLVDWLKPRVNWIINR